MRRGEIRYAEVGAGWGRRPVLVVMPSDLATALSRVVCAPVTTSLRQLPTRVSLGGSEGLREQSEAVCEALATIEKDDIDTVAIGSLADTRFLELDRAIARALDLRRANLLPA